MSVWGWLTKEDLQSLSMAPGETKLQKLKFVLAFFGATVVAKRAKDDMDAVAEMVKSAPKEPEPMELARDERPGPLIVTP